MAGVSSTGAAILAGLGIDVGGSMSIEIGAGNGGLTFSGLPTAGAGFPTYLDPEEAFLAECAKSLGISTDDFRGIVKGGDEDS